MSYYEITSLFYKKEFYKKWIEFENVTDHFERNSISFKKCKI